MSHVKLSSSCSEMPHREPQTRHMTLRTMLGCMESKKASHFQRR